MILYKREENNNVPVFCVYICGTTPPPTLFFFLSYVLQEYN